jgi:hypothetical protein
MEGTLIEQMKLENGLTLEMFDLSRLVAGGRWLVSFEARIEVRVKPEYFLDDSRTHVDLEGIRVLITSCPPRLLPLLFSHRQVPHKTEAEGSREAKVPKRTDQEEEIQGKGKRSLESSPKDQAQNTDRYHKHLALYLKSHSNDIAILVPLYGNDEPMNGYMIMLCFDHTAIFFNLPESISSRTVVKSPFICSNEMIWGSFSEMLKQSVCQDVKS